MPQGGCRVAPHFVHIGFGLPQHAPLPLLPIMVTVVNQYVAAVYHRPVIPEAVEILVADVAPAQDQEAVIRDHILIVQHHVPLPGHQDVKRVVHFILYIGMKRERIGHILLLSRQAAHLAVEHNTHLHPAVCGIQYAAQQVFGALPPMNGLTGDIQRMLRLFNQADALVKGQGGLL